MGVVTALVSAYQVAWAQEYDPREPVSHRLRLVALSSLHDALARSTLEWRRGGCVAPSTTEVPSWDRHHAACSATVRHSGKFFNKIDDSELKAIAKAAQCISKRSHNAEYHMMIIMMLVGAEWLPVGVHWQSLAVSDGHWQYHTVSGSCHTVSADFTARSHGFCSEGFCALHAPAQVVDCGGQLLQLRA